MHAPRGVFVAILFSLLVSAGSLAAGNKTANPAALNGEWKLDIQKSSFAEMPIPQHASLIISGYGNKLTWRTTGVDAGGHPYDYTFNGTVDDKPYPLQGAPSPTSASFKWDNGTLVGRWKASDSERISITTISPNGKMLTVKNASTAAEQVSNWTEVWDRLGR